MLRGRPPVVILMVICVSARAQKTRRGPESSSRSREPREADSLAHAACERFAVAGQDNFGVQVRQRLQRVQRLSGDVREGRVDDGRAGAPRNAVAGPRQFRGAGVDQAAETLTIPAAMFSSRCLTLLVPAITTVTGERLSSHASRA
jgi:hypothetical protein